MNNSNPVQQNPTESQLARTLAEIIDFLENDHLVPDHGGESTEEDALRHIRILAKKALETPVAVDPAATHEKRAEELRGALFRITTTPFNDPGQGLHAILFTANEALEKDTQTFGYPWLISDDANDGINLILREHKEQIEKHYHTIADDQAYNRSGQLWEAAVFCLTDKSADWPEDWPTQLKYKIGYKPRIERLAIAGALIAAEIDRLIVNESKIG